MIQYVNVGDLDAAVVEQFEKDMVAGFQFQPDRFDRSEDGKRYDSATLNIALVGWWASYSRAANAIVGLQSELKAIEAKLKDSTAAVRERLEGLVAPGFFTPDEISVMNNRVTGELFVKHRGEENASVSIMLEFPAEYARVLTEAVGKKLANGLPG
jgi:hypothetical protein